MSFTQRPIKIQEFKKEEFIKLLRCIASIEAYNIEKTNGKIDKDDVKEILHDALGNPPTIYVQSDLTEANQHLSLSVPLLNLCETLQALDKSVKDLTPKQVAELPEFKALRTAYLTKIALRTPEDRYYDHHLSAILIREIISSKPAGPNQSSFIKLFQTLTDKASLIMNTIENPKELGPTPPPSPPTSPTNRKK